MMEALAVKFPSAQEMADDSRLLGGASVLAQIGFCGWQKRIGHRSIDQFRELSPGVKCNR
jgi:hypothetical protein